MEAAGEMSQSMNINVNISIQITITQDNNGMPSTTGDRQSEQQIPDAHRQPHVHQSNSNGNGTGNATIQTNTANISSNAIHNAVHVAAPVSVQQSTYDSGQIHTEANSTCSEQPDERCDSYDEVDAGKRGGPRSPISHGERQRRKRLGLCAYCGSSGHGIDDCRKRVRAEKYKNTEKS